MTWQIEFNNLVNFIDWMTEWMNRYEIKISNLLQIIFSKIQAKSKQNLRTNYILVKIFLKRSE